MSSKLSNLINLINIASVKGEASEGAPFGLECRRALDYMLGLGAEMGFKTFDADGYAGHIEFGEGDFVVGILAHLDVVPAGSGWTSDPFCAVVKDGKVVGRGATDDKGPAIACLYAMKQIMDEGLLPSGTKVRLIVGCDEENGSACMAYYKKLVSPPDISFSPDSDFPIINLEKGIIRVGITLPIDDFSRRHIRALSGGTVVNAVPDSAQCTLEGIDPSALASTDIIVQKNGEEWLVNARGKSAHSAMANKGDNALVKLLHALEALEGGKAAREGVLWLAHYLGNALAGKSLDIAFSDEISGDIIVNFSRARLEQNGYHVDLDIRAPICATPDIIMPRITSLLPKGGKAEVLYYMPHLYLPPDQPPVSTLLEVYEQVTGKEGKCIVTGGGTYARSMPQCVAFGPMTDGDNNIHGADEYIELDVLEQLTQIYLRAVLALAATRK